MDPRFDVELVAVTKRYGDTAGGRRDFVAHSARQLLLSAGPQRLRQDDDVAHDRGP